MSGLSRESRALIDAARDGDDPSGDDRRRVRAALGRKIAIGAAAGAVAVTATHAATGGVAAAGSSAAGSGAAIASVGAAGGATVTTGAATVTAGAVATSIGAKFLVSVAIVGAVGAGTVGYSRHEAATRAAAATHVATVDVASSRTAARPPAAAVAKTSAPPMAPPPAAIAEAPAPGQATAPSSAAALAEKPSTDSRPLAAPAPPLAVAPPSHSSLDAELALLQDAHAALRANEGDRALRLLDEHGRRFPNGALAEESEAARVFALCEVGRVDEARDVAGRFLREHPRSPLAPRVARSCDAEPSTF